jgi:hypothetical protein
MAIFCHYEGVARYEAFLCFQGARPRRFLARVTSIIELKPVSTESQAFLVSIAVGFSPPFFGNADFNLNPNSFPLGCLRSLNLPHLCVSVDSTINSKQKRELFYVYRIVTGPPIESVSELLFLTTSGFGMIWSSDLRATTKVFMTLPAGRRLLSQLGNDELEYDEWNCDLTPIGRSDHPCVYEC